MKTAIIIIAVSIVALILIEFSHDNEIIIWDCYEIETVPNVPEHVKQECDRKSHYRPKLIIT